MSNATPEQKRIITNMNANNMVIAAPGSGKSFTMVEGVIEILKRFPYANVAMVTFTRAATDALSAKLNEKLPPSKVERIQVNTFHGFVSSQLKAIRWNGKLIIGHSQRAMVIRALNQSGMIMDLVSAEIAVDAIGREMNPEVIAVRHTREQIKLFNIYQELCKKDKVADFNALSKYILSEMHQGRVKPLRISHLIVDEVQDTDSIQFAWLAAHTRAGVHTSIVGDDDQAIYSFRSSGGVKIFQQFNKLFTPNIFYLNTCFRCEPEILALSDTLIKRNISRYQKDLVSGKKGGGKVTFLCNDSMESQLQALVELISKSPEGWAILSRSNSHLDKIESMLPGPVMRYGGKSFWDEKDASDILIIMTLFRHPHDQRLLKRVLTMFHESEEFMDNVCHVMNRAKVTFPECRLPAGGCSATIALHKSFARFCAETNESDEIKRRIANLTKWMAMIGIKMTTQKQGPSITKSALDACARWALSCGWYKMTNIAAGITQGTKKDKPDYTPDMIVLSTLHGSKGLEWKKVVILSCNDGQIPSKKSVGEASIEEERRLLYVGFTRAEKELYISWFGKPSFFLNECFPEQVGIASLAMTQPGKIQKELFNE